LSPFPPLSPLSGLGCTSAHILFEATAFLHSPSCLQSSLAPPQGHLPENPLSIFPFPVMVHFFLLPNVMFSAAADAQRLASCFVSISPGGVLPSLGNRDSLPLILTFSFSFLFRLLGRRVASQAFMAMQRFFLEVGWSFDGAPSS